MNISMQEKLQSVYPENFQIKRMLKEITNIRQNKQKYGYQCKMSFVRGMQVSFNIQYLKPALKKYKNTQNFNILEIRIIMKKQYPAQPPIIHCLSDNMIDLNLKPFRNYSQDILPDWSVKLTTIDIIKRFLEFVGKKSISKEQPQKQENGKYESNQGFQIEKVYSWTFLQTFPVKVIRPNSALNGLFIINCQSQIIILEQSQSTNNSYFTKDLLQFKQIVSIFKSKATSNRLLLEIKKNGAKYGIVIDTQDKQSLVNNLIDLIKQSQLINSSSNQQKENANSSSDSEDEEDDKLYIGGEGQDEQRSNGKINIQEVKDTIVYYESLVSANMTSENISSLVELLKKAIQYYSAIGSQQFQVYLEKLKTLMSNQMAQVLLDSAQAKRKEDDKKKQKFQSIIDIF